MKSRILSIAILVLLNNACSLDIDPFEGVTKENLAEVTNALEYATNGAYSLMKDQLPYKGVNDFRSTYARNLHQMLEYPSDNVTLSATTTDPLFAAVTREHFPAQENSTYMWYVAYKIVNTANQNIESVEEGISPSSDHLLGENYFLRAMAHFDLLRLFAKPYSHGTDNPGIILRLNSTDPDNKARATVGESYEQVVSDLEKAAALMSRANGRGVEYASKEAAWALLSRAYLYMEMNDKAIQYASDVIESPKFQLVPGEDYLNSFWNTPSSRESILIIKHTLQDDRGTGSIGSMYLTDQIGWGEIYASEPLRQLLGQHPEDVRNDLIVPQYASDGVTVETRNGIPKYFITKHSYQDGVVTLNSPHVLRLAEMYLNRAEAYAKLGQDQLALDDINVIRQRAGLSGDALYSLTNLQGASSVLGAVLQERRLELAYEGHRSIDLYRNKLDMNRNFPGVQPQEVVSWQSPRNIYYIPQDELFTNRLATQNE
ncbi:RagB/SusD family nutrient uptake outer membrane protein [Cesiribacter sp. SM1]|uniref:RagB/SusD family nutrient uptake outer membrane protein n=1 Tax=Cesiribacter sp. SM1 TaxID=2861196 RepID=UPI001CD56CE3|nr:RagB/SusD family nutrient uptake outer membrane protein [Cesiribacter sp. SM1]